MRRTLQISTSKETARAERNSALAGWPLVALADVAEARLGKMLDAQKNRGEFYPYLRNPNIGWFGIDLSDLQQMRFEESELEKFSIRKGDVLICEGGQAGRAAIWERNDLVVKFQKAIHRVRCGPTLDNHFLVHRLMYDYFSGALEDYYTGATIKHLTGQDLARYRFPLPSLEEQQRIAAILDQADALRRKRRATIEKLQSLKVSVFYDLFGNPAQNPKDWPVGSVGDLAESTQYGTSAPATSDGSLPILRMGNLTYAGGTDFSKLKFIDLENNSFEKWTVKRGDILFNRTNSPDLVGKTAVFKDDRTFAYAGYLVRLRINKRGNPDYVSAYLNSSYGKEILRGMCKSIIGMANINAKELLSIRIQIPPVELQRKFSEKVGRIEASIAIAQTHLAQLDTLFASLQHRAFRGEL